jgi:hypothetical protein
MATPEETKASIIALVTQYNANVKTTREDLTLSPLGKRRALQALYDSTSARVADLRSTIDRDTNGDRRTLERRLFGLAAGADATEVVSYRDATDRVATAKKPAEVGDLMERAAGTGDEMLVRAGFARAWRESRKPMSSDDWQAIVAEYLDQYPGARRDAEALATMTSPRGATRNMLEQMGMTVSRPRELDRDEATLSDQTPARPDGPQLMTR